MVTEVITSVVTNSAKGIIENYSELIKGAANGDPEAIGALFFEISLLVISPEFREIEGLENLRLFTKTDEFGELLASKMKVSENIVKKIEAAKGVTAEGAAEEGVTVLGHHPAYTQLAEKMGAKTFQIPTKIWESMSTAEKWAANQKFLDRMILRGDKIRLATPLNQVKPGSYFEKELNYLFNKGYKVSTDGLWLTK